MVRLGCVEIVGAVGGRPKKGGWSVSGVSSDSRTVRPGDLFFAIPGERFDGHDFVAEAFAKGAQAAVVSRRPDVSDALYEERCILVPDVRRALGDLARYVALRWPGQVIAVTGSNGKTTTKDMIHHALGARFAAFKSPGTQNNDIGVPHAIFALTPEHRFAVIEMGTSAPGEIARLAQIAPPAIGVVTNVGETHLERLRSVKGVALAKAELLEALPPSGLAVLNADDAMTPWMRRRCACDVLTFGVSRAADVRAVRIEPLAWGARFTLRDGTCCLLRLPGKHNVLNALAALAACAAAGVRTREAAAALESFEGPPMRLSARTVAGVVLINDAYNANLRSMKAALRVLRAMEVAGRRVMLCGDMLELGPRSAALHRALGAAIARSRLDVLVTLGEWAWRAGDAARRASEDIEVHQCTDAEAAAERLLALLRPGDVLLVKGSRGARLERVLDRVAEGLSGAGVPLAGGAQRS